MTQKDHVELIKTVKIIFLIQDAHNYFFIQDVHNYSLLIFFIKDAHNYSLLQGILDVGMTQEDHVELIKTHTFMRKHATGTAKIELHILHVERGRNTLNFLPYFLLF